MTIIQWPDSLGAGKTPSPIRSRTLEKTGLARKAEGSVHARLQHMACPADVSNGSLLARSRHSAVSRSLPSFGTGLGGSSSSSADVRTANVPRGPVLVSPLNLADIALHRDRESSRGSSEHRPASAEAMHSGGLPHPKQPDLMLRPAPSGSEEMMAQAWPADAAFGAGGFPSWSYEEGLLGASCLDAAQRPDAISLSNLLVTAPAGNGGSDLRSRSNSPSVDRDGQLAPDAQQQAIATRWTMPTCRRCQDLESEIKSLRTEHVKIHFGRQTEWQERERVLREELQNAMVRLAEEEESARWSAERAHSSEDLASLAEVSLEDARQEYLEEAALAQSMSAWQTEAMETSAELVEAERRREDSLARASQARRHAAEAERQRRDLAKLAGTKEAARVREELEKVTKERTELASSLKRATRSFEAMKTESMELQRSLARESEAAAEHAERAFLESHEVSKARLSEQRQRRALQGQLDTLKAELAEADLARRNAQAELSKKQRQHVDELRHQRATAAERDGVKAEVAALREQLQRTEQSLETERKASSQAARLPEEGKSRWSRQAQRSTTPEGRNAFAARSMTASREEQISRGGAGALDALIHERRREPDSDPAPARGVSIDKRISDVTDGDACREPGKKQCAGMTDGVTEPPVWSEASTRLFEVIERAKERADKRRLLTGAAEDVKARARALEELLSVEADAPGACGGGSTPELVV